MQLPYYITREDILASCRLALAEDVRDGDATTLAVVPDAARITAKFVARKSCVVCGIPVASAVFELLGGSIEFEARVEDGHNCEAGQCIAVVTGDARTILTGERTALNYMQRLSGIATITAKYVAALGETSTKLLDTRKTTPGLRLLEKYAVFCGGGQNHRIGLFDRIMIKDNHRELAKLLGPDSIACAVELCRRKYPELEIEVEADCLEEVSAAADAGVEYILLDNMSNEMMSEAIKLGNGRSKMEASGNITLERLPSLRNLGLDFISCGALTHSAPSVDIGLDIE